MNSRGPKLSVVVPMHNEAQNVAPLVQAVFKALENCEGTGELILVDDGSTDNTFDIIRQLWSKHPNLRGIRHSRGAGQSAALWTGFKASRGDVIATMDGDLQNDPADFPALLRQLQDCDMVCGVRQRRADNLKRRISSAVARWARKVVLGIDFTDSGCSLRVFKRSVLELIPPFDGMHRFMPILAQNGGARVKQLPVSHHPRIHGHSKYGIWNRLGRGICDLLMVRWYLKRQLGRPASETLESVQTSEVLPVQEQLTPN